MPLRVRLFNVHQDRNPRGAMHEAASAYVARCRGFAESRHFQTEQALLGAVREARLAGAALFWIAHTLGSQVTSVQFAKQMEAVQDRGVRTLILAVGPHSGWSPLAMAMADHQLSLGSMTLPHELAALVLAEQIYRASTILQGHPYHLGH